MDGKDMRSSVIYSSHAGVIVHYPHREQQYEVVSNFGGYFWRYRSYWMARARLLIEDFTNMMQG